MAAILSVPPNASCILRNSDRASCEDAGEQISSEAIINETTIDVDRMRWLDTVTLKRFRPAIA
jgi:hypothetical protein